MAAVLMTTTPTLAGSSISVQGVTSCGSSAVVTVRNTSFLMSLGTVRVEATVNGVTSVGSASVLLLPGQTSSVGVRFGGVISSVLSVGVTDNPNPF
jgi:hypothetical protein